MVYTVDELVEECGVDDYTEPATEPTKQDEIDALFGWVSGLPSGSYLSSIMGSLALSIESAIRQDHCYVEHDIAALLDDKVRLTSEVESLRKRRVELEESAKSLERQIRQFQTALNAIYDDAEYVASRTRQYAGV